MLIPCQDSISLMRVDTCSEKVGTSGSGSGDSYELSDRSNQTDPESANTSGRHLGFELHNNSHTAFWSNF